MKRWVEREWPEKHARWYKALLDNSEDGLIVRTWLQVHARPGFSRITAAYRLEDWERAAVALVLIPFELTPAYTARERLPSKDRRKRARSVARLARELAKKLANEAAPGCPEVLALFDPDRALDMLRELDLRWSGSLIERTGYSRHRNGGYERREKRVDPDNGAALSWSDPADELARHFLRSRLPDEFQTLPSLLERLAEIMEKVDVWPANRLARPNANPGHEDAMVFAAELDNYFRRNFEVDDDKTYEMDKVIAACVRIRAPDLDPAPVAEEVRSWLRRKRENRAG